MAVINDLLYWLPVAAIGYVYVRWMSGMRRDAIAKQRATIREALLRRVVSSASAQFSFDPATAHLVHEREIVSGDNAILVELEALYRNAHGEYFLFLCVAGDKGFIKHLPSEAARRFLKTFPETYAREFGPSPGARQ